MAKDKRDRFTLDIFEILPANSQPVLPEAEQREARARERMAVVSSESAGSSLSTACIQT